MENKITLFEDKHDCCGCAACSNICPKGAIKMLPDSEGFLYPELDDELCIACTLCKRVCPIAENRRLEQAESEKKLIGILNLQFTNNYGASIAAAALEIAVKGIVGDEYGVKTVNYIGTPDDNTIARNLDAINMVGLKRYIKGKLTPPQSEYAKKVGATRAHRFVCYHNAFIHTTDFVDDAFKINELGNFAAFIAGSDVIWHPKRAKNFRSDGYFLKFASKEQLKIAYAPSLDFRTDGKLRKMKSVYRDNLKNLDYISVREASSVDFIQELTDKRVYNCCDPAFLVDKCVYDEMISISALSDEERSTPYIYVYILDEDNGVCDYAKRLAREKGLRICYKAPKGLDFGEGAINTHSDGPSEFLDRLKNASYVLTNSFHCVVFSLLFEKKFFSFKRASNSVKSTDLLRRFSLEERLLLKPDGRDIDSPIDFGAVKKELEVVKKEGLDYLAMALSDLKKGENE